MYTLDQIVAENDVLFFDTCALSPSFNGNSSFARALFDVRRYNELKKVRDQMMAHINYVSLLSRISQNVDLVMTLGVRNENKAFIKILNDTYDFLNGNRLRDKNKELNGHPYKKSKYNPDPNLCHKGKKAVNFRNKRMAKERRGLISDRDFDPKCEEDIFTYDLELLYKVKQAYGKDMFEIFKIYHRDIKIPSPCYEDASDTDNALVLLLFEYLQENTSKKVSIVTRDYDIISVLSFYSKRLNSAFHRSIVERTNLFITNDSVNYDCYSMSDAGNGIKKVVEQQKIVVQ